MSNSFPALRATALDAVDSRQLAEFWRQLLGYTYRKGDEPPAPGQRRPRDDEWLVLLDNAGEARLAVQKVAQLPRPTWPSAQVPQQLHLDLTVPDWDELITQRDRAIELGATILEDRSADPEEELYVFADPAGHPFCIFVSPDHPA